MAGVQQTPPPPSADTVPSDSKTPKPAPDKGLATVPLDRTLTVPHRTPENAPKTEVLAPSGFGYRTPPPYPDRTPEELEAQQWVKTLILADKSASLNPLPGFVAINPLDALIRDLRTLPQTIRAGIWDLLPEALRASLPVDLFAEA